LVGGSADLTGSNCTWHAGSQVFSAQCAAGNYVHYGVREFAMTAIMNGMALYGGMIPYGGTFLTFVDYARNAVRMAALMQQRVILVLTHDSIGLGEDGPTHQPVEHVAMLRLTPNVALWRPADAVETAVAWQSAIENTTGPTCLALSRQNLACQTRSSAQVGQIARGGYVLMDSGTEPQIILLATGSEVELVCQAARILMTAGYAVRVVSMPCVEVFSAQTKEYQQHVLPPGVNKRLAVEAGASAIWYQFVGSDGAIIGLDRYGESAPAAELFDYLGFSVNNIVKQAKDLIQAGE
jgi:transketolase